jgi:hypothetical protein
MANTGRPSINKRNREQAKRDSRTEKAQRRSDRAAERRNRPPVAPGEDPDLVGIVPGPQPPIRD